MPIPMIAATSANSPALGLIVPQGINTGETMVGFPNLVVSPSGAILTMTFTQAVTGGAGGLTFKDGASTYTLTYASGSGTNSLIYTIGTTVNEGDSCTLAYSAGSGNIQLANGSFSLESFFATTVTNTSTRGGTIGQPYGLLFALTRAS
jgi:hypothetical protein